MKKNLILIIAALLLSSHYVSAQVKVWANGKVGVNTLLEPKEIFQIGDRWTFYSAANSSKTINYNTYWDPSQSRVERITTDFCSSLNFNTDGSIGFRSGPNGGSAGDAVTMTTNMTITYAGQLGIGTAYPTYQLQLTTNSAAKPSSSSWTISSDARLKDIKGDYSKGLEEVCKLNPIVYRYKKDNALGIKDTDVDIAGLSAQDVKLIFPEAVSENGGYLNLDMHPIIIALINSVKEQNKIIEEQSVRIEELEANTNSTTNLNSTVGTNSVVAKLYQNIPNPFSQNTEIKCIIPNHAKTADLFIYDMQGTQIKKIQLPGRGEVNTTIQGSELNAGMYMYTLIIDGKEVDTKKMFLTN
jgi:ribosomal protein L21